MRRLGLLIALTLAAPLLPGTTDTTAAAVEIDGFQIETVWSGLSTPTAIAFAPNGRVFVSERSGIIKTFDSVSDTTATVAADLSTNVHAVGDRGLLGLAVDPNFPTSPYIYVSYMLDAPPGGTAPYYGDSCPFSPTTNAKDGCPATGRVSRITVDGTGRMVGSELVLIGSSFWCHQQQGHALNHLEFGPDGALYASSGDGGTASFTDWGQHSGDPGGVPPNACGDPPVPAGTQLSLPTTEGGALRSQDLRTSSDPAGGTGAIVRFNPANGQALPDNPLIGGNTSDDRHVAYGLRNPFRFTFRPGTSEIWIADVGWNTWEELDLIPNPTQAVRNFGWPCYEGAAKQPQWDALNVNMCEALYSSGPGAVTGPYWTYRHNQSPDPTLCPKAGSALASLAFADSPPYPSAYKDALFVADYAKECIWILDAGADGRPDPATLETLATGVFPVDLEAGPGGYIYIVDIGLGRVSRITYFGGNEPPLSRPTAAPQFGPLPMSVQFDGSASTDADGPSPLTYAWDLDADGAYDDSTSVNPTRTYSVAQNVTVGLRVTDGLGASGTATVQIQPGNSPPQVAILGPDSGDTWAAGDTLAFSGTATDTQDGSLSAALQWTVILHHCATLTDCHEHPQVTRTGPSGTFGAPEHEYPAYLELRAQASDSRGAIGEASVTLDPRTTDLTFLADQPGIRLLAGSQDGTAPISVTAITGSRISVTAPTPQVTASGVYAFAGWSDGLPASHDVIAGVGPTTLTAHFTEVAGWAHVGTGVQSAANGSAATTLAVGYPTGIQAGDLLLLGCQGRANAQDWSAPGFSSLVRTTVTSGLRLEILYAWASGGESGSLTATNTTGQNGWSCQLTALRGGVGSGSPLDAAPVVAGGTGSTMTAPTVTTTSAGALVTRWYASSDDNAHGNPSTGTLAFGGLAYDSDVGVDHAASMAYLVRATAGSSGTATMGQLINAADAWSAVTLVLKAGGP